MSMYPHGRWAWLPLLFVLTSCTESSVLADPKLQELRAMTEQVDGERLMGDVRALHAAHLSDTPLDHTVWKNQELLAPHWHSHTRLKSGELMESRLRGLDLTVSRQNTPHERLPTSNVIARLPGVTRPEEVVLVGAHFDAFHGGADDNSTGVAGILELARILSQYRFDRTILFVGFDLEEIGGYGSYRLLSSRTGSSEKLVASLVLDCIGYYDTTPGSQATLPGFPSPRSADFLAVIGNDSSSRMASEFYALSRELSLIHTVPMLATGNGLNPLSEPLLRSDHALLWLAGERALFVTDTAVFRNRHYHQVTDTPETLHPELFRKAVQSTLAAVAYWAGGPR
ncbi:hypothetical protein BO221_36035 [Archangium sp. Cb G35]|uniref:M28 family peptidase n=1 Tax=Archangium sp. Cb G35 TaxID=1920190 RepID=UPI000937C293|nr:M28 family peptidase [Archangium sp. Cb G35]OJT19751.1 hypothetical protein BO221_36035 [Archangium sp. Cb G35]